MYADGSHDGQIYKHGTGRVQAYFFPDIHDKIVTSLSNNKANLNDAPNEKTVESVVKIQRFYR